MLKRSDIMWHHHWQLEDDRTLFEKKQVFGAVQQKYLSNSSMDRSTRQHRNSEGRQTLTHANKNSLCFWQDEPREDEWSNTGNVHGRNMP